MSSVIIQRQPANRPGPDITDILLRDDIAKRERGRAEINREEDDRKILTGGGPKGQFMNPGKHVEIQIKGKVVRGSLVLFSRTYSLTGETYQIDSAVAIETLSKAVRPEPV